MIAHCGAVVVFYHPDSECIARANAIAQWCECVVVDNTPLSDLNGDVAAKLHSGVVYVANGANVGIATAINQGVAELQKRGHDAAILFDQDSSVTESLIDELYRALDASRRLDAKVALVGPAYEDPRLRGVAPFVRFGYFRLQRVEPAGNSPIDVDFLISSGSCINLRLWDEIGPMDDGLFIDFVDTEWCMRARTRGYRLLGLPWVRMVHELGEAPVRVLGRNYPMHSPLRHYYLFRNAIYLLRRRDVPLTWKTTEAVKLPFRLLIYAFFIPDGSRHVRMSARGIRDGWAKRMGPFVISDKAGKPPIM
ncbi:glycosyltransferase family 2 protein [Caballeronia sp. SL2Y3]|uniref:glycosyltransferase family 2 protein n=1 Tax=Caballeronia sp. SL2Y3 TaxID=2878151 RepID=UPI001FD16800|nr:glycosyltransferase family 2 protein [Caballeronia sp. SL2Y3]